MILDNLYTTQCDYGNMGARLDRAFTWLRNNDLKAIQPGQIIDVEGKWISAQIQAYDTINPAEGFFEMHRSFIDIQIVVAGSEIMYWTPGARLETVKTPYDYDRDIVFFEEPAFSVPFTVHEGEFAVFFPSDGHKPRCKVGETVSVRKIVVKVAV